MVVVFGFVVYVVVVFLKDEVSLCSPCCPKTHCKNQVGLKLTEALPPLPPLLSAGTKGAHCHTWLHPVLWDEMFTHYCFGPVKVINRKSGCAQGSQRQQKGGEPVLVPMLWVSEPSLVPLLNSTGSLGKLVIYQLYVLSIHKLQAWYHCRWTEDRNKHYSYR